MTIRDSLSQVVARPSEDAASAAVSRFLEGRGIFGAPFSMIEDGDDGWAFWITQEDTTSYVHHDLRIEWYDTYWTPESEHGPELMKRLDRHGAGDADRSAELTTAWMAGVERERDRAARDAEEGSLRFIAKRNLRKMIEIGSTDTKTMLLCLEELS